MGAGRRSAPPPLRMSLASCQAGRQPAARALLQTHKHAYLSWELPPRGNGQPLTRTNTVVQVLDFLSKGRGLLISMLSNTVWYTVLVLLAQQLVMKGFRLC